MTNPDLEVERQARELGLRWRPDMDPLRAAVAPEPVTAPAVDRPCQLYAHTGTPHPIRTQGHHRHPVYLQNRVWGRILDNELLWVCGLCHDSIHETLDWLLDEGRKPNPMPGTKTLAEARRTAEWYWDTWKGLGE
jgi:hypothetical protein